MSLFEAFAIFCGIGIHNAQMYDSACKMMAKQKARMPLKSGNPDAKLQSMCLSPKVALDCLSYHATASDPDTDALTKAPVPSSQVFNLDRWV